MLQVVLEQVAQALEAVGRRHAAEILEQEVGVQRVRVGQHALDVRQVCKKEPTSSEGPARNRR